MDKNLEITVLSENTVERRNLIAEHGLSFYFKYNNKEYLFDTGQGKVILKNAAFLNIDFKNIETVFLSHGHDDHTGGLKQLLKINPDLKVAAHKDIFNDKYKVLKNKVSSNGLEIKKKKIKNFINTEKMMEVRKGIYTTGEILVPNSDYINNRYQKKEKKEKVVDDFNDETSIFIETNKGIVILLGCSHKGVINIIEYIKSQIGNKKIVAILGGMHLKNANTKKVKNIINYFTKLEFDLLAPIHCTGRRAAMRMKDCFEDRVRLASVGDQFEF